MKIQLKKCQNNDIFKKIYDIVAMIPAGKVTTYGAIAKTIGSTSSARLVGYALKIAYKNNIYIPAHRVVNRNGYLTGKHSFGNPSLMQQLLENEGIMVKNDKVINFKEYYWEPINLNLDNI